MKKFLKQLVIALMLINLGLTVSMTVSAQNPCDDPETAFKSPLCKLQEVGGDPELDILPDYGATGQHPDAPPDYGQEGIGTLTSPLYWAIDLFRFLISGVAMVMIVFLAFKLISTESDDEAAKIKKNLLYGVIGLLLIQIADVVVKKALFGEQGEAFEDIGTSEIYAEETVSVMRSIIGFIEVFIGIVAVIAIVIRGFTVLTSGGDEEALGKAKTHILYAAVGLVAILISEIVVRGIIFPDQGESLPDVEKGKRIIVTIASYLAGFIAILSFATLFYGGYQYVVSGGEDEAFEKVKKIIWGAAIALILSMGAYAAVNTLIEFEPGPDTSEVIPIESSE
ncbi:pilin [Patescibacteria group bacterium]